LELRDKDLKVKELERSLALREREMGLELDRTKEELRLRKEEIR